MNYPEEENTNDYIKNIIYYINNLPIDFNNRNVHIQNIISDEIFKFNECQCCERHQINKPHCLHKLDNIQVDNKPYVEHQCYCYCRQKSRVLCEHFAYLTIEQQD